MTVLTQGFFRHQARASRAGVRPASDATLQIFGGDLNRVVIVDATSAEAWPQASKTEIAARIAALIADRLESKK